MNQAHQALPVTQNPLQGRELTQLCFVWSSTSHPPRVFQVKMPPRCFSTLSLKPTWNHLAASHPALIDSIIKFSYSFKNTKSRGQPFKWIFPQQPHCYPKPSGTIVWGSAATFPIVRNICCSIATFAIFRLVLVSQEILLFKLCFCLTIIFLAPLGLPLGTNL